MKGEHHKGGVPEHVVELLRAFTDVCGDAAPDTRAGQLREEALKALGEHGLPPKQDLDALYARTKWERDGLGERVAKLKKEIGLKQEQLQRMQETYEEVGLKFAEKSAEL